jgi:uncharacterized protein YjbJ (UPF0337 family)
VGLEELKGKAKEMAGSLTGSDGLREEGQAQQHKAAEEQRAANAQQVADKHVERAEELSADERARAERAQDVADKHSDRAAHQENREQGHQGT